MGTIGDSVNIPSICRLWKMSQRAIGGIQTGSKLQVFSQYALSYLTDLFFYHICQNFAFAFVVRVKIPKYHQDEFISEMPRRDIYVCLVI